LRDAENISIIQSDPNSKYNNHRRERMESGMDRENEKGIGGKQRKSMEIEFRQVMEDSD